MVARHLHIEPVLADRTRRIHAAADRDRLPASLLERFSDDGAPCRDTPGMMQLIALLRFIGPITGGHGHAR